MMGLMAFKQETPESFLLTSLYHVRTESEEGGCLRASKRVLVRYGICWHLNLRLPRLCEVNVCSPSPSAYGTLLYQPELTTIDMQEKETLPHRLA